MHESLSTSETVESVPEPRDDPMELLEPPSLVLETWGGGRIRNVPSVTLYPPGRGTPVKARLPQLAAKPKRALNVRDARACVLDNKATFCKGRRLTANIEFPQSSAQGYRVHAFDIGSFPLQTAAAASLYRTNLYAGQFPELTGRVDRTCAVNESGCRNTA